MFQWLYAKISYSDDLETVYSVLLFKDNSDLLGVLVMVCVILNQNTNKNIIE